MTDSHETPNMYPNLSTTPLNVPLSPTSLNDQQHFQAKQNQ